MVWSAVMRAKLSPVDHIDWRDGHEAHVWCKRIRGLIVTLRAIDIPRGLLFSELMLCAVGRTITKHEMNLSRYVRAGQIALGAFARM